MGWARSEISRRLAACALVATAVFSAFPAAAQTNDAGLIDARKSLKAVYDQRADLREAFRSSDWAAASPRAGKMADLEEWARLYGYMEYPEELLWYSPAIQRPHALPRALQTAGGASKVTKKDGANFDFAGLTASSVLVIDAASKEVLISRNARAPHPMASITKLMTALVALDDRVPMGSTTKLLDQDEVGGARLRVDTGTALSVRDLFYAMLVGSANNAANAVARATKLDKEQFVAEMNARAEEMGLVSTHFTDPTGIDVGNVSTAEEIAALAFESFGAYEIRRATTTSNYVVSTAKSTHRIKNTNNLLNDENNGLYVLGGKTGYLHESKWNLAVKMMDSRHKPVMVVVLGSASQTDSFKDAEKAAKWVWANYRWSGR